MTEINAREADRMWRDAATLRAELGDRAFDGLQGEWDVTHPDPELDWDAEDVARELAWSFREELDEAQGPDPDEDGFIEVVHCTECGFWSEDLDLATCPNDGNVLGEQLWTQHELSQGHR